MKERALSIWTTLALLPTVWVLLHHRSALAFVYLASFFVTLCYHASIETRWKRTDHALAYSVIASNTWMTFHATKAVYPFVGLGFVGLALFAYVDARKNPGRYDRSHALWHVLSGFAGLAFALGYAG
jgi:hypothetical protein